MDLHLHVIFERSKAESSAVQLSILVAGTLVIVRASRGTSLLSVVIVSATFVGFASGLFVVSDGANKCSGKTSLLNG